MKERPILFNDAMVRAILSGQKTQTRRAMKTQPFKGTPRIGEVSFDGFLPHEDVAQFSIEAAGGGAYKSEVFECPYGSPGDQLWVRETHRPIFGQTCGLITIDYKADPREKWERLGDRIGTPTKWIPSIHMRREYSRIQLEIVSVRVERLQNISEEDARAEGVDPKKCVHHFYDGFIRLWESTGGNWGANPWVWVIEFKRIEREAA